MRRGFTYVEVGVMIAVILMATALAAPNFVRMARQRDHERFASKLLALAVNARSRALESGDTVGLSFDKKGNQVQVLWEREQGSPLQLDSLDLPQDVKTTRFAADKYESPEDGWRIPFYPDGTSAGGGIQLDIDDKVESFFIPRDGGAPTLKPGELPDLGLDRWKAGTYEKRS